MTKKCEAALCAKKRADDAIYNAIDAKGSHIEEELVTSTKALLSRLEAVDQMSVAELPMNRDKVKVQAIYSALREAMREGIELGKMLSWSNSNWSGDWVSYTLPE